MCDPLARRASRALGSFRARRGPPLPSLQGDGRQRGRQVVAWHYVAASRMHRPLLQGWGADEARPVHAITLLRRIPPGALPGHCLSRLKERIEMLREVGRCTLIVCKIVRE